MSEFTTRLEAALGSSYSVRGELTGGSGGMSRVFAATDTALGRDIVVKLLPFGLAADSGAERFEREMRLTASLQHPHVVPVIASGVIDGAPYYTMPFIAGEDLCHRLEREGPLPVNETVRLIGEVADALAFAHAKGVVHRDVKPANVLLSDGHALLGDFGIAKALEQPGELLTRTGVSIGTPAYMAPEQAAGDSNVDHRADIYALGCISYELLTGRRPFDGPTAQALIGQHIAAPFPLVRNSRPEVPRAIDAAIQRATAKSPADRYMNARHFAADLRAAAAAGGEKLPGQAAPRRRTLAAIAALIIAIAGVGFIARLATVRRDRPDSSIGANKSVAVLPLTVVGGDTANLYYADGVTEAIIGAISGLHGLNVTSRASSFAFRNSRLTTQQIGESLHVTALLEGSMQRAGDRIRIGVELVDPRRDGVLWHRTFDGGQADVFGMQDTIARAIVGALEVQLAGNPERALAKPATTSPEAYDQYLRARYFLGRRDSIGLARALGYFDRAIALDAGFAKAYAGLAETYADLTVFGYVPPAAVHAKATAASLESLRLDDSTAEGHTARAFVAYMLDWDLPGAQREFARAIRIDPRHAPAYLYRATLDVSLGDGAAALSDVREAVRLDSYSLIANTRLASYLYFGGYNREAAAQALHVREMDSTFTQARGELARAQAALGHCDSALAEVRTMPRLRVETLPVPGIVYALCGQRAQAESELALRNADRRRGVYISHYSDALIEAALGRDDAALAHLDSAVSDHSWSVLFARFDPPLHRVKTTSRFAAIMARVVPSPR